MVHVLKNLKLESSVLNIYKNSEELLVLDQNGIVHHFQNDYTYLAGLELFQEKIELHRHAKAASFSHNNLIFYPEPNTSFGTIFTRENGVSTLHAKIIDHSKGAIEVSAFSADDGLFATGASDGRTYIYDTTTMSYLIALPPSPDYISSLTFSTVNKYLLSSSFDRTATLYNIQMGKVENIFATKDVLEAALFIRNDQCIYYLLRNGAAGIYNIQNKMIESENNLFPVWPTTIVAIKNTPHVIVGTKSNKIYIINTDTNKVEFPVVLPYMGVSTLKIYENILYIGFSNGALQVINLEAFRNKFILSIKLKNFANAHECIEKNIFLQLDPLYTKTLLLNWDQILVKIIDAIAKGESELAAELAQPYLENKECAQSYNNLVESKLEIFGLYDAIESRNFLKAYAIADKFPFLTVATPFMQLEKHWNNTFIKVKENVKKDPVMAKKSAEILLMPFFKVPSKKGLIEFLLKYPHIVFEAEMDVKTKRFRHYFTLCKTYPILTNTSLYVSVVNFGKNVLIQLEIALKEFDTKKITNLSNFLEEFQIYEKETRKAKIFLSDLEKYEKYLDDKEFTKAFEMSMIHKHLSEHTRYKTIENGFLSVANKAQVYALSGNAKKALELLNKFWQVDQFKPKIVTIAKLAYVNEMYQYKDLPSIDWKKSISGYLLRYGSDDYIERRLTEMGMERLYTQCVLTVETKNYKDFKLTRTLLISRDI